jgi:trehalose/maltose hydrolase-like predicted phosphorylase
MKSGILDTILDEPINDLYNGIDSFIDFLDIKTGSLTRKSDLITILHQAQRIYGYLPLHVQEHIAFKLNISLIDITRIIHFYSFFHTEPQNNNIPVYTSYAFTGR